MKKIHKINSYWRDSDIPACIYYCTWVDQGRKNYWVTRYNKKVTCKRCLKIMEGKK